MHPSCSSLQLRVSRCCVGDRGLPSMPLLPPSGVAGLLPRVVAGATHVTWQLSLRRGTQMRGKRSGVASVGKTCRFPGGGCIGVQACERRW